MKSHLGTTRGFALKLIKFELTTTNSAVLGLVGLRSFLILGDIEFNGVLRET